MPESATTIDRMQVEFSTNLEELIGNLYTVESRLSAVNDSFSQSEAASQAYAASMENIGTSAASSSEGFATLATGIDAFSGAMAAGSETVAAYADSLIGTQGAVTTINYQMEQTVGRFGEVNTAATNAATAIGRINNVSNNAHTTFSRLSTNSTTAMKAIEKLSTETRTLSRTYTTATTDTDAFAKAVSNVGTATNTVITQINEYNTAISTAGTAAGEAAENMEDVAEKTGETEGAMGKLSDVAGKVFAGLSVGSLLATLDTIIERGEQVSQMFQELESDVTVSLGTVDPEVTEEINQMITDLMGYVPAAQNDSLGKGAALLKKFQPSWGTSEYQSLMQEYASYADLWNMNLTDLIDTTQRLFTKYNITSPEAMKEALGKINAVNNLAPDAAPSSVISILNNNRQAIGAQGWDFETALSRVVNAGNDRAMSKFQEYLSALQNVKATKGKMFDSDEAFAAWIQTVTEKVRNAKDETEGQQIIQSEYGIWGTSAMEITKYLRLQNSEVDQTNKILEQLGKNGSGYQMYLKQETSSETLARANSVKPASDRTLGDTSLELKEQIALQNAYDKSMYDVVSVRLGDFTSYVDSIPVLGELLAPFTGMITDYMPEINIKKGMLGTAEEFIDKYERMRDNGDYVPFDENYYLSYRTLADQLKVDYSDLQFTGEDAASIVKDITAGLYDDLIQRVKSARNGEEVMSLAAKTAEVVASSGVNLNTAMFTGTLTLPDGTVLSGAEAGSAVAATTPGMITAGDVQKSWWEVLWPFGSDESEMVVEEEEPVDYSNTLQQINTGIDTLNTNLSEKKGDVYVTQYIYSPTADSYTVKNAAALGVSSSQSGTYRMR